MLKALMIDGSMHMMLHLGNYVDVESRSASYRKALTDVFEYCIRTDRVKDKIRGESFGCVLRLIKALYPKGEREYGRLTTVENGHCFPDVVVDFDELWDESDEHLYRDALVNVMEACMNIETIEDDLSESFIKVLMLIKKLCLENESAIISIDTGEAQQGVEVTHKYYIVRDGRRVVPLSRIALEFSIDEAKLLEFVDGCDSRSNGKGGEE